ncbi:cupin domain-containing protein [Ferruginibacter sp. SUN106]|uniref:cupin domain-containing protein n=1 Tax=Ferruginibacter sp. SUN106 TaxID=2978348 RepID=UPI003D362733
MRSCLLIVLLCFCLYSVAQLQPIGSGVYHWNELAVKKDSLRESRKILQGTTADLEYLSIHATTQFKGAAAKPAHIQKDIEELIIIKEGTMKCTVGSKTAVLGKGSVILIPPLEAQQLENIGKGPLTYYVLQFRSKKMNMERSTLAGGALLLNYDSLKYTEANNKGNRKFFDRPTAMCDNYEMHITYLKQKGPSHAPHQHVDTEIIVVIEGDAEMTIDGKNYTGAAGDLFIAESGKLHGVGNATEKPCSYYAFKWR